MINVSNKFFQTIEKRRNFTGYADVTLADGSTLTLTENEFTLDNNSITESAGSTGLPLGEAICRTVQIEIINPNERYSDYDFVGAKINLELRFWLDGETESFKIGEFTVIDPHTYGETIIITAVDDMYKAEEYYSTKMAFPATIGAVLADVCSTCGINLKTTSFLNDNFILQNRPSGNYIVRKLIGYIAMIAGGNARINRDNELEIISYNFSALEDIAVLGGTFNPWTGGDTLSGGTLNPWANGNELSGGDFVGKEPYHFLKNFKNLKVDTDEIEITGISMRVENDMGVQDLISGTEGYVINVENPLLRDREEEGLALIASVLVGGKMRRFEGDHIAYPLAEFMDPCVVVDKKGNMYPTILTDIDFEFFGYTNFKNTAQSKEEIKPKKSTKFREELVRIEQKAEDLVEAEKTAREEAIKNLNATLGDSSGMYVSDVKQTDGSTVRYLHDKPALVDSRNVIKITANAIGFSNDGGATFPYGLTLNGETITKYLYAEGIDADYITAGRISDSTGQNYWDLEKGELVIKTATIDGSLISVSVTADQITTGKIQDATGANYWDLDSGKIVITDAVIDGATINNISAADITVGTITDKKGNNSWNLETGEMVITKATIDSELIAVKVSADEITTGRITDSTGDNYWDLDSGKMVINDAVIDSALFKNIDADEIVTGRISDKAGKNYFDLDSGEIKFLNGYIGESSTTGFNVSGTALASDQIEIVSHDGVNGAFMRCAGSRDYPGYETWYYSTGVIFRKKDTLESLGSLRLMQRYSNSSDTTKKYLKSTSLHLGSYDTQSGERKTNIELHGDTGEVKILGQNMNDFVVEQGTSGIWSYRKWASGIAECWGRREFGNVYCNTEYYGTYYGSAIAINFPSGLFSEAPSCQCTAESQYVWVTHDKPTAAKFPVTYYYSPQSGTYDVSVNLYAVGKWK